MLRRLRLAAAVVLGLCSTLAGLGPGIDSAAASRAQVALFEADSNLQRDPYGTMATLRSLGVQMVRVYVEWSAVAPHPLSLTKPAFDSADPYAYPPASWATYDNIVSAAQRYHIGLDLLLTGGAPRWADGPGLPAFNQHYAWRPSVREYGNFVHAAAARYRNSVHTWEIYNEPNFGEDLGPQATSGSRVYVGARMYRDLLDAAWNALRSTGHGRDRILIGQLAARGMQLQPDATHPQGLPGNFAQAKPFVFIRALYCVDGSYRPLRGGAARAIDCPTGNRGTRSFAALHPGLFFASGFGVHPYTQGLAPTQDAAHDPNFVAFNAIGKLEATLDRLQRLYGPGRRFPIYNNEYGYVTDPPAPHRFHSPSPAMAAVYLNWAEYLSWQDPRMRTWMQYLLTDPIEGGPSNFYSGLESSSGAPKATLQAYRMPLFLPVSRTRRGRKVLVWGCVRPAHVFSGPQRAQVQFSAGSVGPWRTVAIVKLNDAHGYFTARVAFAGSGLVRVVWKIPGGNPITSRVSPVAVR